MYYKRPHENWFQKGIHTVESGLKAFGVAKGVYDAGRTIYQIGQAAGPALALL